MGRGGVAMARDPMDDATSTKDEQLSTKDEQLDELLRAVAHAPPRSLPAEPAQPGERWGAGGRFVIQEEIGRGGMGVVYRVFDAEMERDVALKTLPSLVPSEIVVLKEEFRALAGVTHPNLIELYELVVDVDDAFFTMELLDGHDIVEHVRGRARHGDHRAEAPSPGWLPRLTE